MRALHPAHASGRMGDESSKVRFALSLLLKGWGAHFPSWLGPCHRERATASQGARLRSPGCPGAKPDRKSGVLLSTHRSSFLQSTRLMKEK